MHDPSSRRPLGSGWFRPRLAGASLSQRMLAAIGALVGIAATALLSSWFDPAHGLLIAAPIGATAVLLFAVPASPLAQPWAVVGGSTLSALAGIAAGWWLGAGPLAAGAAVALAVLAMSLTRSLHPPGGAVALMAVLAGRSDLAFVFVPIGVNVVLLTACAWAFHGLTGHRYPHRPQAAVSTGIRREDVEAAVAELPDSLDVSVDDLHALVVRAQAIAHRRAG